MRELGIAIIGYGGIGRVHALAYRAIPFHYGLPGNVARIVGVSRRSPQAAEEAAREAGCTVWATDYNDLLARKDVDVVDICVPNVQHAEVITAAASAGKHIYCEKPLAMNVAESKEIVAAVRRANVRAQLSFNFRFIPAITRARQLIADGFLGRVFSFRGCFYRSSYINPDKPMSWRLRKDIAGGGALFDLGSHLLDLIYYLLGDFRTVQATMETLIKERPVSPGADERRKVDVDDLAFMQVRMSSGAIGTVEVSRMGTGTTNDLAIEIYGEKGALRFSADEPSWLRVFDARDPDQPQGGLSGFRKVQTVGRYAGQKVPDWSMAPGFISTFVEAQYSFLKAVSDDGPTLPSLADGLRVQEVMEAAERSTIEQRWIPIAEVRGPDV
jgi:predicted dehydrogenase